MYVTLSHLPVQGTYQSGKNKGKEYKGHVAAKDGQLYAWPPGANGCTYAVVCSTEADLKGKLLKGWGTRVDVGNGKSPSILKAEPLW